MWDRLLKFGIIEHHAISGVSEGGYNVKDDKEIKRDIVQYLDNGIVSIKFQKILERMLN